MSATALMLEGAFFFTDVDPEIALKDSRDPLGFQRIWGHFGRQLVGNLTTVTTSVRGFTTMLLGHHVAGLSVDSGSVPAAEYIEPFLRFEQIVAYSRIAWAEETKDAVNIIRGIRRVEARYENGRGRVRIAADRDARSSLIKGHMVCGVCIASRPRIADCFYRRASASLPEQRRFLRRT